MVKVQSWRNEDGHWCVLTHHTMQAFYGGYALTDSLRIFIV